MSGIVGIDPGVNGALAYISSKGKIFTLSNFFLKKQKEQPYRILNFEKINKWYENLDEIPSLVGMELVHSMPRDSKKGAFTFGWVSGSIATYFGNKGLEIKFCNPHTWQKKLLEEIKKALAELPENLGKKSRDLYKIASINYVKQKYPNVDLRASLRSTTDSDGISDAICIGEYFNVEN